jgi:inorganic pyrophosphatase
MWERVEDIEELPSQLLAEIRHFFDVYKMLEPNKEATTTGYGGLEDALKEIDSAFRRAQR